MRQAMQLMDGLTWVITEIALGLSLRSGPIIQHLLTVALNEQGGTHTDVFTITSGFINALTNIFI